MSDDAELLARTRRGEERAFAEFYDRHAGPVFGYALHRSNNADDAEELLQDTFMTALRKAGSIRLSGDSALPRLIVTCRNHAANLRRSQARRGTVPLDESHDAPADDGTLERLGAAEELAWIRASLDDLGEADRRLLERCIVDGASYSDAAHELGLSAGVVTKRIHRIRMRLREERRLREEGA